MEKAQQIDSIIKFSNAFGPSGFEQPVIRAYRDAVKDFGSTTIDGMFNAITNRKGNTGERPVIQLDAHADEVGLLVQAVRPSGLLKFVTLGGFVPTNVRPCACWCAIVAANIFQGSWRLSHRIL